MADRIPCKTPGCTRTILPTTAAENDGYCMVCVQEKARIEREDYIKKNRRDLNQFDGLTDPVEMIQIIHKPRPRDPLINWIPCSIPTEDLYRSLETSDLARLVDYAASLVDQERMEEAEEILACLAAFTDAVLAPCLSKLVECQTYSPAFAFQRASSVVRDQLIDQLEEDDADYNGILLALSWIGDEVVVRLFHDWRSAPPEWTDELYIEPWRYADSAGWELTADGRRKNLTSFCCIKLLRNPNPQTADVAVLTRNPGECPWCGMPLTNLLDAAELPEKMSSDFQGLAKLQVVTCERCATYGTVFGKLDENGVGRWSEQSEKPDYLGDEVDWEHLPTQGLAASGFRSAIAAVDTSLPTTFSQIGGMPAWVQDSDYPSCPECQQTMMFAVQLELSEINNSLEGMYYSFVCPTCKTTAVSFQQT